MMFVINGTEYPCDLMSYAPKYRSGIEWKSVGNVYRPIDHGIQYDKWMSSIKITGTDSQIYLIRGALSSYSYGEPFFIKHDKRFNIFGSEFNFDDGYEIPCCISPESLNISRNTSFNGVFSVLSMSLYLGFESLMIEASIFDSSSYSFADLNLSLSNIDRSGQRSLSITETENLFFQKNFGYSNLFTDVTYTSKNYVENGLDCDMTIAKSWFIQQRTTPINVVNSNEKNYLFTNLSINDLAYVMDVEEGEYSAGKNTRGTIRVTYGKA